MNNVKTPSKELKKSEIRVTWAKRYKYRHQGQLSYSNDQLKQLDWIGYGSASDLVGTGKQNHRDDGQATPVNY